MREGEREIVRVGNRLHADDYVAAVLTSLRNSSQVVVEGLGHVQGKVITVAKAVVELAQGRIIATESFELDGVSGLRITIERNLGGDPRG